MKAIGNQGLNAKIPAEYAAALQALQLSGGNTQALRSLSDGDWRKLLPVMDRARLALPFGQHQHHGLPDWVNERLSSNLDDTARHWERVQAAYREAAAVLEASRVEFLVLKGFAQAPEFVSKPEFRRQGDIDFYVPREDISTAVRALQGIGYSTCQLEEDYRYADHVPTLVRFGTWKWRGIDTIQMCLPRSKYISACGTILYTRSLFPKWRHFGAVAGGARWAV